MGRQTLLIVHKDNSIRREMHEILARFDFRIIYTDNGLQAMDALKYGPGLVISEVDIPMINGIELGKNMRNESATKNIPIIFLHDKLNLPYIKKARNLGAKAFLINPYLDNTLIYAIKRALGTKNLNPIKNKDIVKYEECNLSMMTANNRNYV